MESKFKIGDTFIRNNGGRDLIPLKIIEISYEFEPVYTLKPIYLCGDTIQLGEEGLMTLYNKIK